jgi:hypothetical protein
MTVVDVNMSANRRANKIAHHRRPLVIGRELADLKAVMNDTFKEKDSGCGRYV